MVKVEGLDNLQGIWCVGTIFGTAAGITAFLFLIFNTIRDKVEGD
jgi:hypothetical protein